jgi:hypothetical protein
VPNHVPRTYDVRELPVAGQPLPLDQCSFPAPCAHTLTFSNGSHIYTGKDFGNHQHGAIVVRKVNLGGTQTDAFGFSRSPAPRACGVRTGARTGRSRPP